MQPTGLMSLPKAIDGPGLSENLSSGGTGTPDTHKPFLVLKHSDSPGGIR